MQISVENVYIFQDAGPFSSYLGNCISTSSLCLSVISQVPVEMYWEHKLRQTG